MRPVTGLAIVFVLALAPGCAKKGGEQGGTNGPPAATSDTSAPQGTAQEHGETATSVTPAKSVPGIWQQVDAERGELGKVIEAGSLEEVHRHAFAIRDLVAALPGLTTNPVTKARYQVGVLKVAAVAAQLDEAGDAGDLTRTQSLVTTLDTALSELRTAR